MEDVDGCSKRWHGPPLDSVLYPLLFFWARMEAKGSGGEGGRLNIGMATFRLRGGESHGRRSTRSNTAFSRYAQQRWPVSRRSDSSEGKNTNGTLIHMFIRPAGASTTHQDSHHCPAATTSKATPGDSHIQTARAGSDIHRHRTPKARPATKAGVTISDHQQPAAGFPAAH